MHKHGWNRIDTFSFYSSAELKCPNFYWGLTKLIKLNLIKLGPVLLHSRVTVASTLHCSSSDMTHTFVPQHSSTVKQFKKNAWPSLTSTWFISVNIIGHWLIVQPFPHPQGFILYALHREILKAWCLSRYQTLRVCLCAMKELIYVGTLIY